MGSERMVDERPWRDTLAIGTVDRSLSTASSSMSINDDFSVLWSPADYVEVIVDLHGDEIVLRSVKQSECSVDLRSHPFFLSESVTTSSHQQEFSAKMGETKRLHQEGSPDLMNSCGSFRRQVSIASGGEVSGSASAAALDVRALRRRREEKEWTTYGAKDALNGLRFISKTGAEGWMEVEKNFYILARDGFLHRSDFAQCIGMIGSKEFALVLFDALSRRQRNQAGKVTKEDLRVFWSQISDQSFDSRLQIFFDMVDKNEDGRITEAEVKELIKLSASANNLAALKEQSEEYAALIMEELDREKLGYIELWQLETLLLQKDTYLNYSQVLGHTGQALNQTLANQRRMETLKNLATKLRYYAEEKWKHAWVLSLWAAAMVGLFAWKFEQYRRKYSFEIMGYCLPTAKGAAETLKFNMAVVLLPVCRNTMTWLRSTFLARVVPLDHNICFHKVVATGIAAGAILHAGLHLFCDFPRLESSSESTYAPLRPYFGETKPSYAILLRGPEGLTGILMVFFMTIAFTLATHWFRRSILTLPGLLNMATGYNAFWYSHHLFILVYLLLLVHGNFLYLEHKWYLKTTWMYLAFPWLLYARERMLLRVLRAGYNSVRILKVGIYPGNVLFLRMSKPAGFRYRSGMYIFLKCPDISPFEWHPFSITSAPGDDHLSVHIRQMGDWTRELKRIFSQACQGKFPDDKNNNPQRLPKLLIDGPYGAPAQDYDKYDVLLLVGLGIGATPFVSVLKDLLNNIVRTEKMAEASALMAESMIQEAGGHVDLSSLMKATSPPPRLFKARNAYFYWVTREQGSFEWFKGIMNEVTQLDRMGIIEIHNYLTSVYEEGDARSSLITMIQALNHAKNGVDIVSGTRIKTHFARPNWNKVFSGLSSKHPEANIGVFYCGPPNLANELNRMCQNYTRRSKVTKFHFHKEIF